MAFGSATPPWLQRSLVQRQALIVLLGSSWVRSMWHSSVTLMGLRAAPRRMRFEKHSLKAPAEVDNHNSDFTVISS